MINSFFKEVKVVELASVLAGPAVGMFFAELGAEVVKIENKSTGGDVTRGWKLPTEETGRDYSAYYCSVNWGKKVEFLDLKDPKDRERVYDLIRESDIVISNFKTASAQKMGMDEVTLRGLNPRLIYAQLTAFGEKDTRPAFDIVLQAEAGFLYMTGEADRDPVRMPVALIDLLAAHQLKEAILLALLHRQKSGRGSYVTTSLLEAAVASLANQATNWLMVGHIPQRMGSEHPNIAPYGDIFYTKDQKPITLAIGTEKQFLSLCSVLELEALQDDPLFATNVLRVANRKALNQILAIAFQEFDRAELQEKFGAKMIPAGSIRNMQEVFEHPLAKGMILAEKDAEGRLTQRVKTVAFQMKDGAVG